MSRGNTHGKVTMIRQHFQYIAEVLRGLDGDMAGLTAVQHRMVAMAFAHALADTNDRFDRQKFLEACTKEGP